MKYYDNYKITTLDTIIKDEKDGYYAFEDTIFYPNKGGMLADKGTINNLEVLDLKMIDDILYHKVDGSLTNPIHMEIDFNYRLINTSVQTAFHLLDGYYNRKGLYIIAIGVNPNNEWYEINTKDVDDEHIKEVEDYINKAIKDEIPLEIKYICGKDYSDEKYHEFDELRIVSYEGLDSQPCATPHLNHTGEIANFVVLDYEKTSRGTKVYCSLSKDIDDYFKKEHKIIKDASKLLSVKKEEIHDRLTKLLSDNNELKKKNKLLEEELLNFKLKKIIKDDNYIIEYDGNLRAMASHLLKAKADKIIYQTNQVNEFAIISSLNKAKEIYDNLSKELDIKGGGSNQIYSFKTSEDVAKVIKVINDNKE